MGGGGTQALPLVVFTQQSDNLDSDTDIENMGQIHDFYSNLDSIVEHKILGPEDIGNTESKTLPKQ